MNRKDIVIQWFKEQSVPVIAGVIILAVVLFVVTA